MAISANQKPTTIDVQFHRRYKVLSGLGTMADMHRAAHTLYLDTFDLRSCVQKRLHSQNVKLSDVELINKLLRLALYGRITIVSNGDDYSTAAE